MASTLRAQSPIYGRNNRPSRSTIEPLVEKFESTGTVWNAAVPVRQRKARSVQKYCCRWGFSWRKAKCVSHTSFSSVEHLCDVVVEIILAYILTKSNWRKKWSRLTTRGIVCSWIGLSYYYYYYYVLLFLVVHWASNDHDHFQLFQFGVFYLNIKRSLPWYFWSSMLSANLRVLDFNACRHGSEDGFLSVWPILLISFAIWSW